MFWKLCEEWMHLKYFEIQMTFEIKSIFFFGNIKKTLYEVFTLLILIIMQYIFANSSNICSQIDVQ